MHRTLSIPFSLTAQKDDSVTFIPNLSIDLVLGFLMRLKKKLTSNK